MVLERIVVHIAKMAQDLLHIMGLQERNPMLTLFSLILRITSASPKSFMSKFSDKYDFTSFISLIFVPNITMSSTYRHNITPLPPHS